MPWLRVGDTSSTHPLVFRLLEVCDGNRQLQLECWGFLVMAATVSAAHLSDYIVSRGLAETVAPGRSEDLAAILIASGLMEPVEVDGRAAYKIVDAEDLLHMRLGEEVELDRARKRDSRRPDLVIPVRIRDGDVCRWCGKTVNFADHKSSRGGVIDSLTSHKNSTLETLVVACRGCNTKREIEGQEMTLRKAPDKKEVYYSDSTIAYINNSDYAKSNRIVLTPRQTRLEFSQAAPVSQEQSAPQGVRHAAPSVNGQSAQASTEQAARPADALSAPGPDANGTMPPDWLMNPVEESGEHAAAPSGQEQSAPDSTTPTNGSQHQAAPVSQEQSAPQGVRHAAPSVNGQSAQASTEQAARPADALSAPEALNPEPGQRPQKSRTDRSNGKCNETVKPDTKSKPDPDRQADRSGLSGTGRVGSGVDGTGLSPGAATSGCKGRRRRRGRRAGRSR